MQLHSQTTAARTLLGRQVGTKLASLLRSALRKCSRVNIAVLHREN